MSKTADEFKNEGNGFLKERKFAEALKCYSSGIELDKTNHVLFSNRSLCSVQLNNFEAALLDANECIKLKKDWWKGYLRKSQVYVKQNIQHEALSCLDVGMKNCTEGKQNLRSLFDDLTKQLMTNPKEQHQLQAFQVFKLFNIENFEQKLIQGHPAQARNLLKTPGFKQKLCKVRESTSDTLDFLKDAQIELAIGILTGQVARQERESEMKKKREEKEDEMRRRRVREQEERKRKEKEELKRKENEKPENQEKVKGNEFFKKKDFENAVVHYKKAIEINEKECTLYFNLSACYLEMGNFEEAKKIAEDGLEKGKAVDSSDDKLIFEKIAKGYSRIGNIEFRRKKYKEALEFYKLSYTEFKTKLVSRKIAECNKQIEIQKELEFFDPELSKKEKDNGNIEFKKSNFAGAIPFYRKAIKRNPKDPSLCLNIGTCYMKMGQFPTAISHFEKAIKLDLKYEKAYNRMSQCYMNHFMILSNEEKSVKGLDLLMKASTCLSKGMKECKDSVMLQNSMKGVYQFLSLFQQK